MIRVIVCDDDEVFLNNITRIVDDLLADKGICAKIHMYTDFQKIGFPILSSCDIALLDLDFDGQRYSGIDIARELRTVRPDAIIIFVSNYIEYAPEGYEVNAFRYILKKDIQQKISECISYAVEALAASRATLKIKINGEIIDLPLPKILYIESQLRLVDIHMLSTKPHIPGKVYSYYEKISNLEQQLDSHGFLRIHKSYIVNMKHIQRFQNKEVLLVDGTSLKVSDKDYSEKKKKYLMWRGYQ